MINIKGYGKFLEALDASKYENIVDDVKKKIQSTIDKNGGSGLDSFVSDYLKNPSDVKIEGLINDDQIYDFWLKYENEIDEILNDIRFFDNSPSDINSLGIYKYIIAGTEKVIEEVIRMMSKGDEE